MRRWPSRPLSVGVRSGNSDSTQLRLCSLSVSFELIVVRHFGIRSVPAGDPSHPSPVGRSVGRSVGRGVPWISRAGLPLAGPQGRRVGPQRTPARLTPARGKIGWFGLRGDVIATSLPAPTRPRSVRACIPACSAVVCSRRCCIRARVGANE